MNEFNISKEEALNRLLPEFRKNETLKIKLEIDYVINYMKYY